MIVLVWRRKRVRLASFQPSVRQNEVYNGASSRRKLLDMSEFNGDLVSFIRSILFIMIQTAERSRAIVQFVS